MGLENRLARLEASLSPRACSDARERLAAKLETISEAHLARRQRGDEPVLEGQSLASLLGLVESYPYGAVPFDVAYTATDKAQTLSPAAAKLARICLERKGHHGL